MVGRIAARALAKREATYADEVRRLLDAARAVIRASGTASRPRVADIVAAAGLSNDAFYRHFPSKDALISALIEDGAERVVRHAARRMRTADTPQDQVHRWVEVVLSQAAGDTATLNRGVLWNAGGSAPDIDGGSPTPSNRLATLLHGAFAELGSRDPEFDAALVAHATVGSLTDYLWRRVEPTAADIERTTAFCLRAISHDQLCR